LVFWWSSLIRLRLIVLHCSDFFTLNSVLKVFYRISVLYCLVITLEEQLMSWVFSPSARGLRFFASLVCGLIALAPSAQAGFVTTAQMFGPQAGTGPGLGTVNIPVIFTANLNNDNQTGGGPEDNNITVPIKKFENLGYIDIVFNVSNSGGITEYQVAETVDNDTGIPWSEFTMQLGFGFGSSFVSSLPLDGLDFDAPSYDSFPTSGAFSTITPVTEDLLHFTNGLHSTGFQPYSFRIDVPDGISQFTLRQVPVAVPEPSLVLLSGFAGLGMLILSLKKQLL
jgi:hypothetical protein